MIRRLLLLRLHSVEDRGNATSTRLLREAKHGKALAMYMHRAMFLQQADRAASQRLLNAFEVCDGTPTFANERLLCDVNVEKVHCVVHGFHFARLKAQKTPEIQLKHELHRIEENSFDSNLYEPDFNVLGCRDEHALSVVLRLRQNRVQVFDARHHSERHLTPLSRCFRTRVQASAESVV